MSAAGGGSLKSVLPVQRAHATNHRWLVSFLLCAIGLTVITAVVIAAAMGQVTVAMVIGLVSAAFFAGILC